MLLNSGEKELIKLSSRMRLIVSDTLNTDFLSEFLKRKISISSLISIYRVTRNYLNEDARIYFRKHLTKLLLQTTSAVILRQGIMGVKKNLENDYDGDLDIEETIDNLLESGKSPIESNHSDYIYRVKVRRSLTAVLIIDLSGSMFGYKLINASLACAALAYHLRSAEYGVVGFETLPTVLKSGSEAKPIELVVEKILDSESFGYTNIAAALDTAHKELVSMKGDKRFGILLTDGQYNIGGDPRPLAKVFPSLSVIDVSRKAGWGSKVCRDLASLGRGKYFKVYDHADIPRVITRLVKSLR